MRADAATALHKNIKSRCCKKWNSYKDCILLYSLAGGVTKKALDFAAIIFYFSAAWEVYTLSILLTKNK